MGDSDVVQGVFSLSCQSFPRSTIKRLTRLDVTKLRGLDGDANHVRDR